MKRTLWHFGLAGALSIAAVAGPAWGRGFGGGGFGGGGGFHGGGGFGGGGFGGGGGGFHGGGFGGGGFGGGGFHEGGGGFSGGGGLSGGGFHPSGGFGGSGLGGGGFDRGGFDRGGGGLGDLGGGGLDRGAGGFDRGGSGAAGFDRGGLGGDVFHSPGLGGGGNGFQIGSRPQIGGGDRFGGGNLSGAANRLPGEGGNFRPGAGGANASGLPGLGGGGAAGVRPGTGGAGERLPGLSGAGAAGGGVRPGQGGAGEQWQRGNSVPDRHQDMSNTFNNLNQHWNDSDWHHQQWEGPNGTDVNHFGYWGPNGYWGHTGAWGPNGGHLGHSTGIGPNGAYGRTTGVGPNGAVWGHGGAVGANGAYGYARYNGPAGHWSRNWGGWYNGYAPAWGHGNWNYLWNQYPVAAAFGATMWGLNSVAWGMGISDYYNPYCDGPVIINNQPIVTYTQPVVGDPSYDTQSAAADEGAPQAAAEDPLTEGFNLARLSFYNTEYDDAMQRIDGVLSKAPRDAAVNEFRGLCLFALGRYRESAATIHAVLAAGPGWDWTTMISLYKDQATYTTQLRALEDAAKSDPQAPELRFLLAYHYITCDHKEAAVVMLSEVVKLQPKDKLSSELLQMYSNAPAKPDAGKTGPAPDLEKPAYPLDKLQGVWVAKDDSGNFQLQLDKSDAFTWTFTRGGQPQKVSGAYIVRGNNLVMQPDTGGTMISTITLKDDGTLAFLPVGDAHSLAFHR